MTYKRVREAWEQRRPKGRSTGCTYWNKIAKAIDKQIEIRPKQYKTPEDPLFICAICGSTFIVQHFSQGVSSRMSYCPNCGQKQLWEETEVDDGNY